MTAPIRFLSRRQASLWTLAVLPSVLSLGALWSCTDSNPSNTPPDDAGTPNPHPSNQDGGDGAIYPAATVTGKVLDQVGGGFDGAKAVIVDAVGRKQDALTGKDGTFTISGVVAPYDVSVEAGRDSLRAYLGLTRTDPLFRMYSEKTGRTYPNSRYVDANIIIPVVPGCATGPSSGHFCSFQIGFSSLDGEVHEHQHYEDFYSGERIPYRFPWHTSAKRVTLKAHLLTQPAKGGSFYHSAITIDVDDEGSVELTWPAVEKVPRAGSWTISAQLGSDIDAGWNPPDQVSTWLNLPNGEGSVYLGITGAAPLPLTVDVPNIPGATLGAAAHLQRSDPDASIDREIRGAVDAVPLDTLASSIAFTRGDRITSPAPGEDITSAAGTLTWSTRETPAIYRLEWPVVGEAVIESTSNHVSLARLRDLGVPVSQSAWKGDLSLTTRHPFVSIDDLAGSSRLQMRDKYGVLPPAFMRSARAVSTITVKP